MNTKDFSNQNLQGHSFRDADLTAANFIGADIRGTDFTNANLTSANFSNAKAGLQRRWAIILTIIALLFTSLSNFISSVAAVWTGYLLSSSTNDLVAGVIIITSYVFFITVIIQEGLQSILKALGIAGLIAVILTITGTFASNISLPVSVMAGLSGIVIATGTGIVTLVFTLSVTTSTIVFALWSAVVGGSNFLGAATGLFVITSVITSANIEMTSRFSSLGVLVFIGLVSNYVSISLGRQAIAGNKKHTFIREMAIAFAAIKGTSFSHANLTNADFTGATLKSIDFREAILINTCWRKSKKLDRVRSGTTYLKNAQLHRILVTGQGQAQNFNYQDLRGINLQEANLTDASFIGADLSGANLQDANLTRAKLVQTQLDGTDFKGATLTGAYIEDWNITTDTKFDGVRCEYVYMRLPTPDNPDPHRKPDNRQEVFADGEFGDFIKPIFDTLDLYHSQGVDPRAIAISFKQLAENNPEADLRIVGMEVRGEDKFLLRAKTAIAADKSELSAEYFATYNQLKALAEQEVKALIAEKNSRIADLQNMVVTALQRPSFYSNVEQVGFMTNNPGGFSVGGSVDGDINNVQGENNQQRVSNKSSSFNLQGAQFAGGLVNADTVNAHQIGGNITNYSTEQRQNLAEAAAEIQQLLNQLSQTYPTATTSEKMTVVAKAVDEIENNPTLKARVIGALKAGGTEAFKELIDHPLVNILLASIEGWQEVE